MKINIKKVTLLLKTTLFLGLIFVLGFFVINFGSRPAVAVEYTSDSAYDKEIWQLNEDINNKRKSIEDLQKQTDVYKQILQKKQQEIFSLRDQIGNINTSIAKVSLEIQALELQVEEVNLKLESTELKIAAKQNEIAQQKQHMGEVIRALDRAQQGNNLVMVLATKNSLGDYIADVQSLSNLESSLYENLDEMNSLKMALLADKSDLESNKEDLESIQEQLGDKQGNLESQKYVKNSLVKNTQGEESKYQKMLEQAKKEVAAINSDIVYLEQVAREKLNREISGGELGAEEGMMWPVPSQFVTAYFHDPDYPFRYIFEHPAIDIRASQGSEVRAAKSGYVAKAKDAGKGYSYIVIVHDDGITTVYGHISKIMVSQDSFVSKGQIIGMSGGTPGTAGAGQFVTGPHLHFEVRVNGIPVNPLNYLP